MGYERKPDTGVLFKNKNKKTDRHPDYNGTWYGNDGQDYWLSCWINESRGGQKYMSLSLGGIKQQQSQDSGSGSGTASNNFDEDIPFNIDGLPF